jgi:hypothetical protein
VFADRPHDNRSQYPKERPAGTLSEARKLGHRPRKRRLILAAEQGGEQPGSRINEGRLSAATDRLGEAVEDAGLLFDGIDQVLCPTGFAAAPVKPASSPGTAALIAD